jgi:NAD(P)H-nitrite reductase large subunit
VHFSYLIIGGGMTAAAAVQGIREIDTNNPIGLIGAEAQPPYKRPLLSKALWKGEPVAQVWIDKNFRTWSSSLAGRRRCSTLRASK